MATQIVPAPPVPPLEHVERFLHDLQRNNCSPHTLRGYGNALREFFAGRSTIEADHRDVRRYLQNLYERGCGPTTRTRQLDVLHSFYNYAVREGLTQDDPTELVDKPQIHRPLPKVPSVAETLRLLDGIAADAKKEATFRSLRDWTIFELLYGCGLRTAELTLIDLGDLDTEATTLLVHGKGNAERMIPFNPKVGEALAAYQPNRKALLERRGIATDALILDTRGGRFTNRSVHRTVKWYGQKHLGDPNFHPRQLRYAFCTHMLENGADLRSVQLMTGHEFVSNTQRYINLSIRRLKDVHDMAHPHAKGGRK